MTSTIIVEENNRTDGRMPQSYWDVAHTRLIEGFTTDFSVNAGNAIDFKINVADTPGSDYQVEIFRLGYYGGDGGRMVAAWNNTEALVQPDAIFDPERGTVDAGNWSVTDSWDVPADAVSGVYLARLQRVDAAGNPVEGAVNQIPFVVREDDRPADIVLQTSDTTWQAYNGWAGNNGQIGPNFYGDPSGTITPPDLPNDNESVAARAYAVSYNRPFISRGIEGEQGGKASGAQDYLFGADYAAISWLEQNGYDVSYVSGIDTDRLGPDHLAQFGAFLSVGHDEYWSGDQRANVEAARDAGTHLLFWSGNEIYWRTRWETSAVDGQDYRTLVSYKETWSNINPGALPEDYPDLDPSTEWTGTWRDLRFIGNPLAGTTTPEHALTGQSFLGDGTGQFGAAMDVPEEFAALRYWRDTTIAAEGGAVDLTPGILGYEWNTIPVDEWRPAGLVQLTQTEIEWPKLLVDQGNRTEPGTGTHALSLYRAESGALVFGAGTVFWTWALSDEHDNEPYAANIENTAIQQFTVNMFADMGIQPGVTAAVLGLQGLVLATASDDVTHATATIDDLPATLPAGAPVLLTGTATDDDGDPATADGLVALVELSFDSGATWTPASGTTDWSYLWAPDAVGDFDILVRAIDDSINLPANTILQSEAVEATAPEAISLFDPWTAFSGTPYTETAPLQLGTRFTVAGPGQITELHYYRDPSDATDTDTRTARLWDAEGALLATATFVSDPGQSGWQTVALSTPVDVLSGRTYVAAYETANSYVASGGFFGTSYSDPFGLVTVAAGTGGVFASGAGDILPTQSFGAASYWVDVTYAPGFVDNGPPVFTSPAAYGVTENTIAVGVATADDEGALRYSIAGGADAAAFSIDALTGALSYVFAPDHEAPADSDGDNVYAVTLGVSDGFNPVVTQGVQVSVTDDPDEAGDTVSTVFGPGAAPARTETGDTTDYELGTRFTASADGEIVSLRYWRGLEDAGDTDSRVVRLWDASGTALASAVVTSAPGQTGWQVGVLPEPVRIDDGQIYTVSYGTTQNYAVTGSYFGTAQPGPDGILTGTAAAGVFAAGTTGLFPTQSYLNASYWVDVGFVADMNEAPVFSPASLALSAPENQTVAGTVTATDVNEDSFVFAIAGGDDAGAFEIGPDTGLLTFRTAPDFEIPGDADGDNAYRLILSVSDGVNAPVEQAIEVAVTDVLQESAPDASTLFGAADLPAQTVTGEPTDYELGVQFVANTVGSVVALRYWRGAEDAGDTDTRTLNLWDGAGNLLASETLASTPGQTGWQTVMLQDTVLLDAGVLYVASYGTEENYAVTGGDFVSGLDSADGLLSVVPEGGVFYAGDTGIYPTSNYDAGNYWVDLVFEASDALF